jgi:hypothetical protein
MKQGIKAAFIMQVWSPIEQESQMADNKFQVTK